MPGETYGPYNPLNRLIGGAFTVFQQLKEEDKRDFDQIKAALYTAFAADGFMEFDQFVE